MHGPNACTMRTWRHACMVSKMDTMHTRRSVRLCTACWYTRHLQIYGQTGEYGCLSDIYDNILHTSKGETSWMHTRLRKLMTIPSMHSQVLKVLLMHLPSHSRISKKVCGFHKLGIHFITLQLMSQICHNLKPFYIYLISLDLKGKIHCVHVLFQAWSFKN